MDNEKKPHQGAVLNELMKRSRFTIVDIAAMLNVRRRTVYLWISKEKLSKRVLDAVSEAIGIDLYKTRPDVFGDGQLVRPVKKYAHNDTPVAMEEYWKKKYLELVAEVDRLKGEIK